MSRRPRWWVSSSSPARTDLDFRRTPRILLVDHVARRPRRSRGGGKIAGIALFLSFSRAPSLSPASVLPFVLSLRAIHDGSQSQLLRREAPGMRNCPYADIGIIRANRTFPGREEKRTAQRGQSPKFEVAPPDPFRARLK